MTMPNIVSMETLCEYLENNFDLRYPVFEYIKHQISIAQTIKNDVTKVFLLQEAEFYSEDITLSAKRFIAKRLYAFYAKKKFDLLEERLQCFPNVAFQPSVEILLKILTFDQICRNEFLLPSTQPLPKINRQTQKNSPVTVAQDPKCINSEKDSAVNSNRKKNRDV